MAILNRIVNILILLLVITAGVFSFMLFAKRAQLTDGMRLMAEAINKAARTMDDGDNSGTKSASALTKEALAHTNYDKFPSVLAKLDEQTKKVMQQRNDLAKMLTDVAGKFNLKGYSLAKFQHLDNYKNVALIKDLEKVKNHYNQVSNKFAEVGRKTGASVSAEDFRPGGNYNAAVVKINGQIDSATRERNTMRSDLAKTGRVIGHGAYNHINSAVFQKSLARHDAMVKKLRSDLATAQNQNRRDTTNINNLKKAIEKHKETIENRGDRIKFLENVVTADGKKPMPAFRLTADSPECYKEVKGKISYVSSEYGFVQLDIGKSYIIIQEYGAKKNPVPFPLQSGLVMTVTRGVGENAIPVGKILVKTVNENDSICNIVKGNVSDFKVGDDVYFGLDDLKRIPAAK